MIVNQMLLPVMAMLVGLLVFMLVVRPLKNLLSGNKALERAQGFFVRMLLVIMVIGSIGPVIGSGGTKEGQKFMEFLWQQAGQLGDSLVVIGLYLFGFVVLMTVLAATLGRNRD